MSIAAFLKDIKENTRGLERFYVANQIIGSFFSIV